VAAEIKEPDQQMAETDKSIAPVCKELGIDLHSLSEP
jgi:hypothetical protein